MKCPKCNKVMGKVKVKDESYFVHAYPFKMVISKPHLIDRACKHSWKDTRLGHALLADWNSILLQD